MGLPNLPAWGGGAGPPAEWGHGSALLMKGIPPPLCLPLAHCVLQRQKKDLTVMFMPLRT